MGQELYYNGVGLHGLGTVRIGGESVQGVPEESPQRWQVTLRVTVDFHEHTFADNRLLLAQVREALKVQHGVLKWQDGDYVWMQQTVDVAGHDLPEDPNSWGTYAQRIEIQFRFWRGIDTGHLLSATFQKEGSPAPIALGHVTKWREGYRVTRFEETKGGRKRTAGSITAAGRFYPDPALSLAARRAAMVAAKEEWKAELNGASGTLTFGTAFNGTVRIEEFDAEVDQATDYVEWAFSASFTKFPAEGNFAVAEFKVGVRDNIEDGEQVLVFSGSIGATDEPIALAKLAALRTAVLAGTGFTSAQLTSSEIDEGVGSQGPAAGGDATNTDPDVFTGLTFNESYRKRRADVLSWTLKVSDQDDVRTGLMRTTYSGRVVAGGASVAAAYAAAKAKAEQLGASKYQFLVTGNLSADYRVTGTTTSGAEEFVGLEFSYEYQRKATGRTYIEVTSEASRDPFGRWTDQVSGYVAALDEAAARAAYVAQVRAGFNASLLLGERTSISRQRQTKAAGVAIGAGEVDAGAQVTTDIRLEFSFSVHVTKGSGDTAMRYGFDVDLDYVKREKVTRINGVVQGATKAAAEAYLGTFLYYDAGLKKYRWGGASGTILGTRLNQRNGESREVANTVAGSSKADVFVELSFDLGFRDTLTGDETILECEMSEEFQFSGTRWVVQPVLDGASVVQNTGTTEGSRTVRGSVRAVSEIAAIAWVRRQMKLPFPAWGPATPGTRYPQPPTVSTSFEFVELTEGVGRAGAYGEETLTANLRVCVMQFSASEVLPEFAFS